MNKQHGTESTVEEQGDLDVGRRNLLKLTGVGAAALGVLSVTNGTAFAQANLAWNKTFPKSVEVWS